MKFVFPCNGYWLRFNLTFTLIIFSSLFVSAQQWEHMWAHTSASDGVNDPRSLTIGPNDQVLYSHGGWSMDEATQVWKIEPADSSLTLIDSEALTLYDAVVSPDGQHFYGADGSSGIRIYDIAADGTLSLNSTYTGAGDVRILEFYDDNYLYGALNNGAIVKIPRTPATGALGASVLQYNSGINQGASFCTSPYLSPSISDIELGTDGYLRVASSGTNGMSVDRFTVGAAGALTWHGSLRPSGSTSNCSFWGYPGNDADMFAPKTIFTTSTKLYTAIYSRGDLHMTDFTSDDGVIFVNTGNFTYGACGINKSGSVVTPSGGDELFFADATTLSVYADGNSTALYTIVHADMDELTGYANTSNGGLMFLSTGARDDIHVFRHSFFVEPLAVKFISIDATKADEGTRVSWSTASEEDNAYFDVERSRDGKDWEVISQVEGSGNSSKRLNYEVIDDAILDGKIYYRIKQNDLDGSFTYSNIRSVQNYLKLKVFVYPNPAKNEFSIEGEKMEGAKVIIVNCVGQNTGLAPIAVSESKQSFDSSKLPRGVYFVTVERGGLRSVEKIVIQ